MCEMLQSASELTVVRALLAESTGMFSRSRSKLASSTSSYSKAKDQPFSTASVTSVSALVTKNRLQLSGGGCVTLVKGSLVQQKVSLAHSCCSHFTCRYGDFL